jgi:hypothetical protein
VSDKSHNFRSLVSIYSQLLPDIRAKAKELGYAIALHGSMARDFDLFAIPWVEEAVDANVLVQMIADEVDGYVIGDMSCRGKISQEPTPQPHGRMSWNICWGGNAFIDLSVMPKRPV